jgi:hypothetical protein
MMSTPEPPPRERRRRSDATPGRGGWPGVTAYAPYYRGGNGGALLQ